MPTTADFETLFDLTHQGPPNTGWLAASAIALVLALGTIAWRRRAGRAVGVAGFFAVAFGVVLGVTGLSVWDHHRLRVALHEGSVRVAEGVLQSHTVQHRAHYNFSSKRYDRSIAESFYVGPVAFGFIRDGSVAGFTNSGDRPLALVNGETLRLHYVEDAPGDFASRRIVRLERRRGGHPAAASPWVGPTAARVEGR